MDLDSLVNEDEVNLNIQYWDAHCQLRINSSNPRDYIDCEGFRNLVEMGKPTLPFIYKAIKTGKFDGEYGWRNWLGSLVRNIARDEFKIPKEMAGKVKEIREYTINWLENYVKNLA